MKFSLEQQVVVESNHRLYQWQQTQCHTPNSTSDFGAITNSKAGVDICTIRRAATSVGGCCELEMTWWSNLLLPECNLWQMIDRICISADKQVNPRNTERVISAGGIL